MSIPHHLVLAISLAFMCCLGSACANRPGDKEAETREIRRPVVLVEPVRRRDLAETLAYPVDIEAEVKVSISALMSERIVRFPWENGDQIKKGQVVARIRADNAAQALAQMRAERDSLDAQIANQKSERRRAEELLDKEVITRQTYENLDAQVKVAEAKRRSVEAAISQTAISAGHAVIRAPISGIIANKRANQGDLAAPQIPLCDIMTEDPVKVVIKVPEREIAHVHLEQPVAVALDAFPGRTFGGRVAKILPYMDPTTRTNEVEVLLPNPVDPVSNQRVLKPGMFGRATIVARESRNALVVPERALLMGDGTGEGEMIAFVADEEDTARKRSVKTGIRQGDLVAVQSGLKEGDMVVVRGQHGLTDGQPIKRFDEEGAEKEDKGSAP
jgi:membrane fusion protein (multidrug efflux system)